MFKKIFRSENKNNLKIKEFKILTNPPTSETCPYCGYKFEKIPTRKKKCPECENYIFVRFGRLYTEDEKDIFDWLNGYNIQEIGITRDLFNKTRQELSKQFGFLASPNDTFWRLLNVVNTPDKSYRVRRLIYLSKAHILELEGKSNDEVLAQAREMEILEGKETNEELAKKFRKELLEMKKLIKDSGIEMSVKINTCNDELVCDECKKASKVVYTIDEVLDAMPIPHNCTNTSCRCWLSFTFPDNN